MSGCHVRRLHRRWPGQRLQGQDREHDRETAAPTRTASTTASPRPSCRPPGPTARARREPVRTAPRTTTASCSWASLVLQAQPRPPVRPARFVDMNGDGAKRARVGLHRPHKRGDRRSDHGRTLPGPLKPSRTTVVGRGVRGRWARCFRVRTPRSRDIGSSPSRRSKPLATHSAVSCSCTPRRVPGVARLNTVLAAGRAAYRVARPLA